jgi:hypothetical protein
MSFSKSTSLVLAIPTAVPLAAVHHHNCLIEAPAVLGDWIVFHVISPVLNA